MEEKNGITIKTYTSPIQPTVTVISTVYHTLIFIVVSLLSVSYDYLDFDTIAKTWEHRHFTTIKST